MELVYLKNKKIFTDSNLNRIIKECFWDMQMSSKKIIKIVNGNDLSQKKFLFRKILLNSTRVLNDLKIFNPDDLKVLIEEFRVPQFNYDYIFRRHNIVEVYFLDKPLLIDELKWVA